MTSAPQVPRQVNPTEVGWQFVPQYYTFVNKQPNRLHCFYTKNSTFSHGTEGEDTKACFGQQEIHNKIMALNYENCKVFIHSVDAQSSANSGILIQVVGEMSNRDEPWKKFVQTFFLAEQPNGYFVLNDIFRFLKEESADEGEEEEGEEATAEEEYSASAQADEHTEEPPAPVPVSVSVPVDQVSSFKPEEANPPPSASPAPPAVAEPVVEPEPVGPQSTETPQVNGVNGHSEAVEPEEPKEPEPTPAPQAEVESVTTIPEPTPVPEVTPPVKVPSPAPPLPAPSTETPQKSPAPTPAPPPPAPSGPKTWATLAASNNKKWGSVASDAKGVSAAAPQTPSPAPSPRPTQSSSRQPQEQSSSQAVTTAQCFVKGVTENVSEATMREILTARFGPIKELEIIRSKACAFLEFTTVESARKAIQASLPTHAGGEGGIRLEAKLGATGQPPRLTVERRKERDERPPPRPRGGAPAFGEGRGAIGIQPGEGRGGPQGNRGRGAARGRGGPPKS